MINCRVIEGAYADVDKIRDDFVEDYLGFELSNGEIRDKYALTWKEFRELSEEVKSEYGLSRRPKKPVEGKFYYKTDTGFIIQKRVDGVTTYFGHTPTEELAKKCVELCKKYRWNVDVCKDVIKSFKVGSPN